MDERDRPAIRMAEQYGVLDTEMRKQLRQHIERFTVHVVGRQASGAAAAAEERAIGLVIVGDEILSGKRADKHMPKVIELLAARGLQLAWAEYVGDDPARITATLLRAFDSGDIVFSCGGIGATPDD